MLEALAAQTPGPLEVLVAPGLEPPPLAALVGAKRAVRAEPLGRPAAQADTVLGHDLHGALLALEGAEVAVGAALPLVLDAAALEAPSIDQTGLLLLEEEPVGNARPLHVAAVVGGQVDGEAGLAKQPVGRPPAEDRPVLQ